VNLIKEYSVSEVVNNIKTVIEGNFFYVKVRGEVANFKKHVSGHCYFTLKDIDSSMLNVVMFRNFAEFCKVELCDGVKILASGKLTIYKERSVYQLMAEIVQLDGVGEILKIIQERKEKLAREGLFDLSRKKPVPKSPKTIGLITAEGGAALQDILARLKDRTPITILLYPTLMQGKDCPQEVIRAIKHFNNARTAPDVLVITRGGGSTEDLMAFNDEEMVRAIATSKIPIITAIGHEIDWTLADYASDLRLPTPTSVAEHLTITKSQALERLNSLQTRLIHAIVNIYTKKSAKLDNIFRNFVAKKANNYSKQKSAMSIAKLRLENVFKIILERYKHKQSRLKSIDIHKIIREKFTQLDKKMQILYLRLQNYTKKYPILKDLHGNIIFLKHDMSPGEEYYLEFPDGVVRIRMIFP